MYQVMDDNGNVIEPEWNNKLSDEEVKQVMEEVAQETANERGNGSRTRKNGTS